jgi:hypothetical protein
MHLFKALTECDDATLISLLIEEDGSQLNADPIQAVLNDPAQPEQPAKDYKAYKAALSKKLVSKSGSFVEKVFEIFKGIYKTKDNKGTLALMRKRPAVAQAADYIIKLYDQYAKSQEVLDAMAAVKNDPPDTVRDALPRLTGKVPQGVAQRVQDTFAKLVELNIAAVTINFMQSDEAKNLDLGIPDGSDGEVTPQDVATASGKKEAPAIKPAGKNSKPDFLSYYVGYKEAIDNGKMSLNQSYKFHGWLEILAQVATHYESTLKRCLERASREQYPLAQIPDSTKVYRFTTGQVPLGRDVKTYANTIATVGDPRVTVQGPSYYDNQFIAVNQLGPFYDLGALFGMAGGVVSHHSFYCCVLALEYLDRFIKSDLAKVKGPGTMRIRPVRG